MRSDLALLEAVFAFTKVLRLDYGAVSRVLDLVVSAVTSARARRAQRS